MAFLILDIETVPRVSIDDSVESEIIKRAKARVERTGDDYENSESIYDSILLFESFTWYCWAYFNDLNAAT